MGVFEGVVVVAGHVGVLEGLAVGADDDGQLQTGFAVGADDGGQLQTGFAVVGLSVDDDTDAETRPTAPSGEGVV